MFLETVSRSPSKEGGLDILSFVESSYAKHHAPNELKIIISPVFSPLLLPIAIRYYRAAIHIHPHLRPLAITLQDTYHSAPVLHSLRMGGVKVVHPSPTRHTHPPLESKDQKVERRLS